MNVIVRRLVAFVLPLLLAAPLPALQGCGGGGDCCKVCTKGKTCGDTCIALNQTCTAGAGCACNK